MDPLPAASLWLSVHPFPASGGRVWGWCGISELETRGCSLSVGGGAPPPDCPLHTALPQFHFNRAGVWGVVLLRLLASYEWALAAAVLLVLLMPLFVHCLPLHLYVRRVWCAVGEGCAGSRCSVLSGPGAVLPGWQGQGASSGGNAA